MTKKKAKQSLNIQLSKLRDKSYYKDDTWVFQTASFVNEIFGKDSEEYAYIGGFTFVVNYVSGTLPADEVLFQLEQKKHKVDKFISNCIETIDVKGVYKKNQHNFIETKTNKQLITYSAGVLLFVFFLGYMVGAKQNPNSFINKWIDARIQSAMKISSR